MRNLVRRLRVLRNPKEVRRKLKLRCAHCGHKFRWLNDGRHSLGNRDGTVYHQPCISYVMWRDRADERLAVLALTLDLSGLAVADVKGAAELRAADHDDRATASNRAFRVFRDLEKAGL